MHPPQPPHHRGTAAIPPPPPSPLLFLSLDGYVFAVELPTDLLTLFGSFNNVSYEVAKLKVLDDIPNIMNKVAVSLDRFANAISLVSNRDETSGPPSQTEWGHSKKTDKGKKPITLEEQSSKEYIGSESNLDVKIQASCPMVESSLPNKIRKLSFVIETGKQNHYTEKGVEAQKMEEDKLKALAEEIKLEIGKAFLLEMLGQETMEKYY
ncbi:hypothetical protein Tco_0321955 [Tanacetum coccineum]